MRNSFNLFLVGKSFASAATCRTSVAIMSVLNPQWVLTSIKVFVRMLEPIAFDMMNRRKQADMLVHRDATPRGQDLAKMTLATFVKIFSTASSLVVQQGPPNRKPLLASSESDSTQQWWTKCGPPSPNRQTEQKPSNSSFQGVAT